MGQPLRIVSMLSSATEILFRLGVGEQVVAVSHECDYPARVATLPRVTSSKIDCLQDSATIDRQVAETAGAGTALYQIDSPRIVELAPDIIVTQSQCDVCAVRYQDVLDLVAQTPELRQTQVVALNPTSLEEVFQDVLRVAEAVGAEAAAKRLVAALRSHLERVVTAAAAIPENARPRIACIEWIEPLMLAANWMPELVELAGGQNVVAGSGHSTYSEWDEVRDFDPEVILVMPCGFDLERTVRESEPLEARPGWGALSAVKSGRVYAADGNAYFNRSGPRLVDSLEMLAHFLHPSLFPRAKLESSLQQAFCKLDAFA